MPVDYHQWAAQIERLYRAIAGLQSLAAGVGVAPPRGLEWFELLERKLLPQVATEPLLVIAVTGGTNIGKSVVFNHLAGEMASAVSPLAAKTKHPVCLVPESMENQGGNAQERVSRLFEGFSLRRWQSVDDPLSDDSKNLLFWRKGAAVPPRLLILDTPDVDSSTEINWQRADAIRQAADVLIAVLTEQKYNDAAVKRFFRKAVEADKPIIVVFNQCDLEADREVWPQWLDQFTSETRCQPEFVYAVPKDRGAAAELRLPFYAVGRDGRQPGEARSLRDDLASLHFDAIKIRTFRGALDRVLDARTGAPNYVDRLRQASDQFVRALEALSREALARFEWPTLPTGLVLDEIQAWWEPQRSGFARGVHGFYRVVTNTAAKPLKAIRSRLMGPSPDPLEALRREERQAMVRAVERFYDYLSRLSEAGNEVLRPRLQKLLGGAARSDLIARLEAAHAALPMIGQDYREFLMRELDAWAKKNPGAIKIVRSLDQATAIGRPAITVALAVSGAALTGADHALVGAVSGAVTELVKDMVVTTTLVGGGEALVTATGKGLRHAAARLLVDLQSGYARLRARWLAEWLERELLAELLADLRQGAAIPTSAAVREAEAAIAAFGGPADAYRNMR